MSKDNLGDWRIEAVATLAQKVPPAYEGGPSFNIGDRLYLTTLTKTSKGELIAFTTPNTSALALNVAFASARSAEALKAQFQYRSGPSPWGSSKSIVPEQNPLLFSFFEHCLICVTFSFQTLEAFCNYSLSRTWRKPVEVKRKKAKETIHHEIAERELSTEEKLKSLLPKIYGVPTPAGKAIWDKFIKLKRARDACVHIKYHDQYPLSREIDQESLFFQFLDNDPLLFPATAKSLIEYFFANQQRPRWLEEMPHHV